MDYKKLGANIKSIRKDKEMTQAKLAELAGISNVFMSQIETGTNKPSLETIYNIANALNYSLDELIDLSKAKIIEERIINLLKNRRNEEKFFALDMLECMFKVLDKNNDEIIKRERN